MLRRLGIRWKILAILAVPIAVLTAGALLISLTAVSDSRTTRQVANLINAAEDMRSVVESLQYERYASIRLIQAPDKSSTRPAIQNELEQSRWLTDESLNGLREHVEVIDFDLLDERLGELVENTVEIHARLNVLRSRVDSDSITEGAALTGYNDIIRNDVQLPSRIGGLIDERDAAQFLSAYSTLDLLIEYLQQERNLGEVVINSGVRDERTTQDMQTLIALQDSLRAEADAELAALDTDARIPSIVTNLPSMRLLVQTGTDDALRRMDVEAWLESVDRVIDNIDPARVEVIEVASKRAEQAATDARNQAILTIGGTSIAVIFSLVLALIVARGIVNPLRRLTSAAEKVRDDLPRLVEQVATPGVAPDMELEAIPVESKDEIGQLASAFNSVNETTVVVAREQAALRGSIAEMFVNVARRDQVLLNRQLSFITQLERTEEDPAQLEDLFRLDHLATRMRRNAESLLVLAGIDSGRRLRNPMAVSDVVRTASSEIEHYDRIDLVLTADPAVLGHAALTVAHLLAELMENATVFSDPASRVEVMTAMREDGVAISITDDGLGMDAAAVADVNEKIQSSSASDVIGAQRLGMFVVGRLASRHGIAVQISSAGEGQGTRVDVLVPLALLDPQSVEQQGQLAQQHTDFVAGGYQPNGASGVNGLPVRGAEPALPVRGAEGLPVRGGAEPALPVRQSPAVQPLPPAATPRAEEPVDASARAGLFTGFRSVSANPLESLESVDASAFESDQGSAYVPLVTEDRDSDLTGLSRAGRAAEQEAARAAQAFEPAFEPEISFEAEPIATRRPVPAQPAISYDNAPDDPEVVTAHPPVESETAHGAQEATEAQPSHEDYSPDAGAAPSDQDEKPQTQIRVYTGAFPTATGEYPTYTGEIPVFTGETSTYPSRRSRREMRPEDAQPVASVDHHVEFEPIGLEDDDQPEVSVAPPEVAADPVVEVSAEPVAEMPTGTPDTGFVQQPVQHGAQNFGQPQFGGPAWQDPPTNTGGFPSAATPGIDVVKPQPAGSFNQSVLSSEPAEEKPKRKRFGLFGRKQEPETVEPHRESRFPGATSFTPEAPAAAGQNDFIQPQQPPAAGTGWSPSASAPQLPQPQPQLPLPQPQQQEPARDEELPQRQSAFQPQQPQAQPEPQPEPEPAQPAVHTPSAMPTRPESIAAPQTSWAPTSGGGHGALGAEAAEELRRRSAMTSEVLSELSQLSTYQPEAQQQQPAASLTKRVPTEVPKQEEDTAPAQPARRRDASQVRSMLSGFQAGVNRAASDGAADSVQDGEER